MLARRPCRWVFYDAAKAFAQFCLQAVFTSWRGGAHSSRAEANPLAAAAGLAARRADLLLQRAYAIH
eukprot:10017649-Lingulodinium_polyedra.AAC.1